MTINTNFIHNILNFLMIAVPALQTMDWTPFFSEATSLKIVGGLALAKILINLLRDGLNGLYKHQPPIV